MTAEAPNQPQMNTKQLILMEFFKDLEQLRKKHGLTSVMAVATLTSPGLRGPEISAAPGITLDTGAATNAQVLAKFATLQLLEPVANNLAKELEGKVSSNGAGSRIVPPA